MNKIYKVVWSKVKNCYVVVSEIAKNVITGAVKSAKVGSSVAMGAAMAFVITGSAMAADIYDEYPVFVDQADQVVDVKVVGGDITTKEDVYVLGNNSSVTLSASNVTVTGLVNPDDAADVSGVIVWGESADVALNATEKLGVTGMVNAVVENSTIALNGSNVGVTGNVIAGGSNSVVSLSGGEVVTITGDVEAYGNVSEIALNGGKVDVTGNVIATGTDAKVALDGSEISVGGNVSAYGIGSEIILDGNDVTVDGDVYANKSSVSVLADAANKINGSVIAGYEVYDGNTEINLKGSDITVDAKGGMGVVAWSGYYANDASVNINFDAGETGTVNVSNATYGLMAYGNGTEIGVEAGKLNIADSEVGMWVANRSFSGGDNLDGGDRADDAKVILGAETDVNITNVELGIAAQSQGTVEINGNLKLHATDIAIDTRGEAATFINKANDSTKVVDIVGDIVFDDAGDGRKVDSEVVINLANDKSSFTGSISNIAINAATNEVTGMKLGLSNGATWNVTDDSFVNELAANNGNIVKAEGAKDEGAKDEVTLTVTGNDNVAGTALKGNANVNITGVDLVIDTEKTAIYNQDIAIESDSDVTIKSENGQGISAFGEVEITANNVTIESFDNGIQSVADKNPADVGFVTIVAEADEKGEGGKVFIKSKDSYAVTNVSVNGGVIDIAGKDVTLISEDRTAVKVGHIPGTAEYNGTVNVTGETITIEGAAQNPDKDGDGVLENVRKSAAVYAQKGTMNLTAKDAITIENTGDPKGSAIGAYEGGVVNITSIPPVATYMEGQEQVETLKVTIKGQVTASYADVAIKGADVTVNSVEDALDTWGGNIDIDAANSININSSAKDGVQANDATVTLDAVNVDIQAEKWGINNIAENDSSVVIDAVNVELKGKEGAIRTLNNGNGGVTVKATGTTYVEGDIYAEGYGAVTVGFNGPKSELKGSVATVGDNANTNLSFADGATWTVDANHNVKDADDNEVVGNKVTNLVMNDGNLVVKNAKENAITVGTLTGDAMNVDVNEAVKGTVVVEKEDEDGVRISVSTNGVHMSAADTVGYGKVVTDATGKGIVDEINANNTYISGDVKFETDGKGGFKVVSTTLNGDVNVTGTINGVDVTNAGGLERNADSKYYQTTTIEGKTTIDSMGRVYTNHVFADQAIVVGDHSTLDSTGLYVGKNFKVDKETGDVEAGKVNGAEISDYMFNGVVLDKDGDVLAKDVMATGGITAIGNITSLQGVKAAGGKFVVDGATGNVTGGTYNGVNVENLKDQVDANIGRIENVENRVTENEFAISQNKQDIATNAEKIETNNKLIAENRDAIADNAFNIESNKQAIADNEVAIETNKDAIEANKQAIEANKDAIEANKDAIEANKQAIETNKADIAANKQAIADEAAAREAADKALSDAIDDVAGDIADTKAQVEANKADIADNKAAIEQNAQDLANEVADRVAADNKLQQKLDKESVDRQIADAQERAERAQADQALQNAIDAEEQARKDADAAEAKVRSEEDQRIENKFDGEVNRLDNRIDKVDAKIDKVGAMAAAMASLKTMGYDPEAPTEIAVGIGQYRNETGIAIGAFHYPNKNFMLNFSLSTAGDEVMGGIGATWKIGRKR